MADFKTHITVSTTLGVAYGAIAYKHFGLPAPTCVLAGTLCSVSGMLPDLDSDSGVPLRESLAFGAACVPVLIMERLPASWSRELIVLTCAAMYLGIRFGLGKLLKKYTVHRGMFHSLPAAAIAFFVAFLVCVTGDIYLRTYKACGVLAGFMSHLLLDEVWSVDLRGARLKSSFGTAVKLWGDNGWDNLSCYAMLALFGVLAMKDPVWTTVPDDMKYAQQIKEMHQIASKVDGEVEQRVHVSLPSNSPDWLRSLASSPSGGATTSPPQTVHPQVDAAGNHFATNNGFANNNTTSGAGPYPAYSNGYSGAATVPPQAYQPPMYTEPPTYNAPATYYSPPPYVPPPQPYSPPPAYSPPQPYTMPQPYTLPPSQQANSPGYTPYVSPRY